MSTVLLLLFALPFAAVGVGATAWLWHEVLLSQTVLQSWTIVPAVVDAAELETYRGSKGGNTYQTKASYHYDFAGRTYTGNRVGLFSGGDNVGGFQQSVYHQLSRAKENAATVDCYVNPDDPSQAVLHPHWRPEMVLFKAVFGLAFGAVGLTLFIGGLLSVFSDNKDRRLKNRYPTEPWLWRAEWHSPVLRSGLKRMATTAIVAIVWVNLVTWPLWSSVIPAWQRVGGFKWAVSILLLVVLALTGFCVHLIISARKYGASRLELDELPLRPGQAVVVRLYVPQTLPTGATLQMTLKCVRKTTTGQGKQRRIEFVDFWSHEQSVPGLIGPFQPIEFRGQLPHDAPVTTDPDQTDQRHDWKFIARADVPGVDLKVEFAVPVFARS